MAHRRRESKSRRYDYSYTPGGTLAASAASGGTGYAAMSDVHGDLAASFSPGSATSGLAGSASYSPYGAATEAGYQPGLGYQGDWTDPSTGQVENLGNDASEYGSEYGPVETGGIYPWQDSASLLLPGAGSSLNPCAMGCYPPPPPPPPQDCYAGPNPTCAPVKAPQALRTAVTITARVHDVRSYTRACRNACVHEKRQGSRGPVIRANPKLNSSNLNDPVTVNVDDLIQAIDQLGAVPDPQAPVPTDGGNVAETATGGGSHIRGGGGGGQGGTGQDVGDPSCGGESFTAGTRVLLADGKTAPISSVKKGDKVEAADTKTGKNQAETATAVLVHHDTDLYDLTIKTSHGTEVIHTTSNQCIQSANARKP